MASKISISNVKGDVITSVDQGGANSKNNRNLKKTRKKAFMEKPVKGDAVVGNFSFFFDFCF